MIYIVRLVHGSQVEMEATFEWKIMAHLHSGGVHSCETLSASTSNMCYNCGGSQAQLE
jgi:hypothetical protein